ncbi:hypothetical protein BV20DRAFT_1119317 [Pilatotrama ljubarskyi]|nr:hypothetical protein BV20DRAFT_1119317 [Pilatotrama ljubarskyi]
MSSHNSNWTPQLTPSERALKESLTVPDFRDLELYAFSRRTIFRDGSVQIGYPLPILAISSILKDTEYFSKLLTSGFAESDVVSNAASTPIRAYATQDEYDYESDSDLDEFEEPDGNMSAAITPTTPRASSATALSSKTAGKRKEEELFAESPELPPEGRLNATHTPRRILLPSIAHRTLRAFVFYLYTKRLNFLPLRSGGLSGRQLALLTAGDAAAPPCSPKSMYRLAELYGITTLQSTAYDAIMSRVTPVNVVEEAFSSFFARYDRLCEDAVSYLSRNFSDPRLQASLQHALDKVVSGLSPHAGPILRSLLGLRILATVHTGNSIGEEAPLGDWGPSKVDDDVEEEWGLPRVHGSNLKKGKRRPK